MTINLKEPIIIQNPGLTHGDLVTAINTNEEIIGFDGAVEVEIAYLDEEVPQNFVNSSKDVGTEEVPNIIQKTWREYTNFFISLDGTTAILLVGNYNKTNPNEHGSNKDTPSFEELLDWVEEFTVDEILTRSEYKAKLNSSDYKAVEEGL